MQSDHYNLYSLLLILFYDKKEKEQVILSLHIRIYRSGQIFVLVFKLNYPFFTVLLRWNTVTIIYNIMYNVRLKFTNKRKQVKRN